MLRDGIRNRVVSHSRNVCTFSLGLRHLESELHRDLTHIAEVMFSEEFFNKNFINHLTVFYGQTSRRNEQVHASPKNYAKIRFNGARHRCDADIYVYSAMMCLTIVRNHTILNVFFS